MSETSAYKQLTGRRRKFVDFYCSISHGVKADAARRAGYSNPKQEGYRLYREPDIKAAIEERLREASMGTHEILSRLDVIARNPLPTFLEQVQRPPRPEPETPPEEELIALHERRQDRRAVREAAAAERGEEEPEEELIDGYRPGEWFLDIQAIKEAGLEWLIKKVGYDKNGRQAVEFLDPMRALELLGKYRKLFTDRVEHTGLDGKPIEVEVDLSDLTDEELEAFERYHERKRAQRGGGESGESAAEVPD